MQAFLKGSYWVVRAINLILLLSFGAYLVFTPDVAQDGWGLFKILGLVLFNWWAITIYAVMTGVLLATWRYAEIVKFTQKEGPGALLGGLVGATATGAFLTLAQYSGDVDTIGQTFQMFTGMWVVALAALVARFTIYFPLKKAYEDKYTDQVRVAIAQRESMIFFDADKLKVLEFDELVSLESQLDAYEKTAEKQQKRKDKIAEVIGK